MHAMLSTMSGVEPKPLLFHFPGWPELDHKIGDVRFEAWRGREKWPCSIARRVLQQLAGDRVKDGEILRQWHMHRAEIEAAAQRRIVARRIPAGELVELGILDLVHPE